MGENLTSGQFRIKDLTVQKHGGTSATFVRVVQNILIPLRQFFRRTRHHYTRFNYLGEWHSHPDLPLAPSQRDCESMWEIVDDPSIGANFVVLIIIHLEEDALAGRALVFLPGKQVFECELVKEST